MFFAVARSAAPVAFKRSSTEKSEYLRSLRGSGFWSGSPTTPRQGGEEHDGVQVAHCYQG